MNPIRSLILFALWLVMLAPTHAQQTYTNTPINVGTTANDRTGDTVRDAFIKANRNFTNLYDWISWLRNGTNVNKQDFNLTQFSTNVNGSGGIHLKSNALLTNLTALTSDNGSGLTISNGVIRVTRNFDAEAGIDAVRTMEFRNYTEIPGVSEDYQNQVMLWIIPGRTNSHRGYFVWANYDEVRKWMMGRNADSVFILYNTESGHRLWFEPVNGPNPSYRSGISQVNSYGSGPVAINKGLSFDPAGNGGFEVWSGGSTSTNQRTFKVFNNGDTAIGANSTPAEKFHVEGSGWFHNQNQTNILSLFGHNLSNTVVRIGGTNSSDRWWNISRKAFDLAKDHYNLDISQGNYKGDLTLLTSGFSGNVGIGTTNPTVKLDVVGAANISGNLGVGVSTPAEKFHVEGSGLIINTLATNLLTIVGNNLSNSVLRIGGTNILDRFWLLRRLPYDAVSDKYSFDISPADYKGDLTFLSTGMDGNVGIKTGTPKANLHVNGSMALKRTDQGGEYQINSSDYFVKSTATSNKTLPDASDSGPGRLIVIKSGASATTTILPALGDTIEGGASDTLTPLQSASYVSDGVSNWDKLP